MVIRSIGLVLLAFILQSTVVNSLSIVEVRPDVVIIALVYVGLAYGPMYGMLLGFSVGLLQDFYGPADDLGLNALCKTLMGFGVGLGKDGLYKENPVIILSALMVAMALHDLLYFSIDTDLNPGSLVSMLWRRTLPSMLYTGLATTVTIFSIAYRKGRFNARRLFSE